MWQLWCTSRIWIQVFVQLVHVSWCLMGAHRLIQTAPQWILETHMESSSNKTILMDGLERFVSDARTRMSSFKVISSYNSKVVKFLETVLLAPMINLEMWNQHQLVPAREISSQSWIHKRLFFRSVLLQIGCTRELMLRASSKTIILRAAQLKLVIWWRQVARRTTLMRSLSMSNLHSESLLNRTIQMVGSILCAYCVLTKTRPSIST